MCCITAAQPSLPSPLCVLGCVRAAIASCLRPAATLPPPLWATKALETVPANAARRCVSSTVIRSLRWATAVCRVAMSAACCRAAAWCSRRCVCVRTRIDLSSSRRFVVMERSAQSCFISSCISISVCWCSSNGLPGRKTDAVLEGANIAVWSLSYCWWSRRASKIYKNACYPLNGHFAHLALGFNCDNCACAASLGGIRLHDLQ